MPKPSTPDGSTPRRPALFARTAMLALACAFSVAGFVGAALPALIIGGPFMGVPPTSQERAGAAVLWALAAAAALVAPAVAWRLFDRRVALAVLVCLVALVVVVAYGLFGLSA